MTELFVALALAVALEGAIYALFPRQMRAVLAQVMTMPDAALRIGGVVALALGVLAVWLLRAL